MMHVRNVSKRISVWVQTLLILDKDRDPLKLEWIVGLVSQ
jgi:hypothetical protein